MKAVKSKFIKNKQGYQQETGEANSEAGDIDERESFMFPEIAEGSFEIVFKHRSSNYATSPPLQTETCKRHDFTDEQEKYYLGAIPPLFIHSSQAATNS